MNRYDDNFADDLSQPATEKARPGWFKRNWLWLVPTLILLPLLCCCGGPMAFLWFGMSQVFELPPYKDTVALMELDPTVQQELGTPITTPEGFGDLIAMMQSGGSFNINTSGAQMDFDADIPVSGPNGSGRLVIIASSSDGGVTWIYTTQEVQVDATGNVIDLLPAGSGGAIDIDTDELIESVEDALEAAREERGLTIPDQE